MGQSDPGGAVPVRRPLLGVALAFVLGTAAGMNGVVSPRAAIAAAVATVVVAFVTTFLPNRMRSARFGWMYETGRCLALFAAAGAVAWVAAGLSVRETGGHPGAAIEGLADGARVKVTGIVAGDPETPVMARGSVWTFPLRMESVSSESGTNSARGIVRVRWRGDVGGQTPAYGDRWQIEGRLSLRESRNPEWRTILSGGQWSSRRLSSGHGSVAKAWCYAARKRAADMLSVGIGDRNEEAGVLRALMLGYRSDLDPDLHAMFVATGTLHIFAISGSHIVILAGLILAVLRALRVPRMWWGGAVVPILTGFTLATGAEASAVRACVMASVYWVAPLFGRKPDALSALALSALLILGFDPGQLREAGFVFSFAVVLGLIVMHPLLDRRLRPLWRADPLRIEPERRVVVALRHAGKYMAGLVSLTIVAWVVSTPITACWFGRFTFSAMPANLVVVPLTGLTMLSGCLSLVLGQVWIGFADVFNNASLGLIDVMLWVLTRLQRMPAGNAAVAPWSAWMVGAWYAALTLWAYVEHVGAMGQPPIQPVAEE